MYIFSDFPRNPEMEEIFFTVGLDETDNITDESFLVINGQGNVSRAFTRFFLFLFFFCLQPAEYNSFCFERCVCLSFAILIINECLILVISYSTFGSFIYQRSF